MKTKKAATYTSLITIVIVVLLNILADKFFLRLDFTADDRYTLSEATLNILEGLNDPITIKAYFSEDLPPDIAKMRRDFKELLLEYETISNGMIVYEFIDPTGNEELEQEAIQNGVGPVIVNIREKNEMKKQKVFLGLMIQMGEAQDAIPVIQPGSAMEYTLSSTIKKLSVIDKPSIGIVQGHSEPTLRAITEVYQGLSVLYNVEALTLDPSTPIDARFKTIAIIAPKDSFPPSDLQLLDMFLANGGNILLAIDRVAGDFQTLQGTDVTTGIESWLLTKGIDVGSSFVVDQTCNTVSVRQGNFPIPVQVAFPYMPKVMNFNDHPTVKGLEALNLQFVSPINFRGDTSAVKFTRLATTSANSGTMSTPLFFDVQKQWTQTDFPMSNITVAALFKGKLAGEAESSMIIITDGEFAINGEQRQQRLAPDHLNLMVNSADFLSDDTGLIDLRTKLVTSRPLDELEDGTKTMLQYLNFSLPILLILIYGFVRFQMKRNVRIRRMQEDYSL